MHGGERVKGTVRFHNFYIALPSKCEYYNRGCQWGMALVSKQLKKRPFSQ